MNVDMRNIKFRAKGIKSCRWYYGSLVKTNSIVEDYDGKSSPFSEKTWYAIDPATIGQYVQPYFVGYGKDRKDIGLWEGDIVRLTDEDYVDEPVDCVVRWGGDNYPAFDLFVPCDLERCGWRVLDTDFNALSAGFNFEVIGNIHDQDVKDFFTTETNKT